MLPPFPPTPATIEGPITIPVSAACPPDPPFPARSGAVPPNEILAELSRRAPPVAPGPLLSAGTGEAITVVSSRPPPSPALVQKCPACWLTVPDVCAADATGASPTATSATTAASATSASRDACKLDQKMSRLRDAFRQLEGASDDVDSGASWTTFWPPNWRRSLLDCWTSPAKPASTHGPSATPSKQWVGRDTNSPCRARTA